MSNNAKTAYKKGSMPISKWHKKDIINKISEIVGKYDIPFDVSKLDKMSAKEVREKYLKKDGYHHTSKFYNTTDFYKVDIEKILENKKELVSSSTLVDSDIQSRGHDLIDSSVESINDKKQNTEDIEYKRLREDAETIVKEAIRKSYPHFSDKQVKNYLTRVTKGNYNKLQSQRKQEEIYNNITDKLDDKLADLEGIASFPELSYENQLYVDYEKVMEKALDILNSKYVSLEDELILRQIEEGEYYESIINGIYERLDNEKNVDELWKIYDNADKELPTALNTEEVFNGLLERVVKNVERIEQETEQRRIQEDVPRYSKQTSELDSRPMERSNEKVNKGSSSRENRGSLSKEIIRQVAPKTAKKQGLVEENVVNSPNEIDEQISKLETKKKRAGKGTVLYEKYQKQIDELRNKETQPNHIADDSNMVKNAEKSEEEKQLKTKKGTYYNKAGNKREFEYVDEPPKGWVKNEMATTAPNGFLWYSNGKSIFNGRKQVLVKDTPFSEELKGIQKTEKYKNLPDNLQQAIDFVFENEPVKILTGQEFQKDNTSIVEKVTDYYKKYYPNGVNNIEIGNIKLDKEGVKDSLGHGIGSLKASAYMAVPNVIQKGFVFDKQTNWKNRGYDTAVIIAPIEINNKTYACEVVIKKGKNRQGFYLHEVEITNKLADVFKTVNDSTPTSSKLIITDLINNLNPDVKNSEQTRETDKGIELYSEDNSLFNTNDDEKLIGKALYTINKEAKRIRDVRENLKEFLFEHEDLNETTLEYLRAKYPNITFDPEKGAVYVDENDGTYNKDELYDYIWELERETDVLYYQIEEAKENNEDTTELEDEYEFNKSDLDYLKNEYEKLNDINFHELLKRITKDEQKNLYDYKRKILNNFQHKKKGIHKFNDETARELYEIGGFTFHGEDISNTLSQEEFENLELLDNISSENKLADKEKITVEEAKKILNEYLDKKNKIYKFNQEILDNSDNVSKFWNYKKTKFNDLIYRLSLEDVIEKIDNFAELYCKKISLPSNIKQILKEKAENLNITSSNSKNAYGSYGENTIKINKTKSDKLPVFVMALSHEYWHNVQDEIKQEILKIPQNERTNEQNKFIEEIEKSREFYKEKADYLKKYPKVKKIIIKLSELKNIQERQEYVEKLNKIDYIRYKYFVQEILPKYDILETENEAFEIGNYFAKGYDNGQRNVKVSGRNRKPNISSDKIRRYINGHKRRRARNNTEEELSDYSSHIPDDIDEILPKVKPPKDNLADRVGGVISTRADIINPKIKHALRRFEFESGMNENKYTKDVKGFITKLDFMTPSDYAKYDLALKNGNKEVINTLNSKYNLGEDYTKVRNVLDNIRDEALNVGMNIGFIDEYFPRKIINASAILDEYSKSTYLKKMLHDVDPNNVLSPEDKIEKLNNFDGKKYF